jgi:formylmethanofuran dehydrogenase subunit E
MIDDDLLERAVKFHGHLGPFLILGLKMGLLARERLKPDEIHSLKAVVRTKLSPPHSCIMDGIQVASSCTLGKNNIHVIEDAETVEAIFETKKKSIRIRVRKEVIEQIVLRRLERDSPEMIQLAENIRNSKHLELFKIEEK